MPINVFSLEKVIGRIDFMKVSSESPEIEVVSRATNFFKWQHIHYYSLRNKKLDNASLRNLWIYLEKLKYFRIHFLVFLISKKKS